MKRAGKSPDQDEVQRCRGVRRSLERRFKTLDAMAEWLTQAEQERKAKRGGMTQKPRR